MFVFTYGSLLLPTDVVPLHRIERSSARTALDPGLDAMVGPWRS